MKNRWARLSGGAKILVAVIAVVVVGGLAASAYGVWYLFLQGPGPAAVATTAPIPSGVANELPSSGTDGQWVVDTTVGTFSDFSNSWVGYRVQEEMASIGANTAVGRTPDVSGSLTLQGTKVQSATITADLTTLQSDDPRRDGQLSRQGIETSTYPTATFTLTEPLELDSVPADGETRTVTGTGELTLHGVTKSVQVPLSVTRLGDLVGVTGSIEITFADYSITPPSSFIVLSIDDHGTMEFQLFFRHS